MSVLTVLVPKNKLREKTAAISNARSCTSDISDLSDSNSLYDSKFESKLIQGSNSKSSVVQLTISIVLILCKPVALVLSSDPIPGPSLDPKTMFT